MKREKMRILVYNQKMPPLYGGGFQRVYKIFTSPVFYEYDVQFFSKCDSDKSIDKYKAFGYIIKNRVDYFYITSLDAYILPLVYLALLLDVRVVIGATLAGKDTPKNRSISWLLGRLKFYAWRKAEIVVVNSIQLLEEFSNYSNVKFIPNGVDESIFKTGIKKEGSLLYVGAIVPRKGLHRLLEILSQYSQDILEQYSLHVLGNGSGVYYEKCITQIHALEQKGLSVQITSHVLEPEKYFAVSEYFVFPSLSEGMPNVILEAIASNCRVLTTEYVSSIFDFDFAEDIETFHFGNRRSTKKHVNLPRKYTFESMCISYRDLFI